MLAYERRQIQAHSPWPECVHAQPAAANAQCDTPESEGLKENCSLLFLLRVCLGVILRLSP